MARLIDADAWIENHCDGCKYLTNGLCDHDICGSVELIKEAPTVDAETVVRCEKCANSVYGTDCPEGRVWCKTMCRYMKNEGYCSFGEVKE